MANSRQGGAFGFLRKSIGSVTYSTIKDGKGKRIQVARSKPVEVANPNTVAQILQRMKVKPAARFYNAFAEVLDNAFEGVAYGPASRRHFMGLAMSQTGPYIPKGATRFIPAKYPVSEGGLNGVPVAYGTVDDVNAGALYSNKGFSVVLDANNFGNTLEKTFWDQMIERIFGGVVQITVLAVTQEADGSFVPHYGRFLSDTVDRGYDNGFKALDGVVSVALEAWGLVIYDSTKGTDQYTWNAAAVSSIKAAAVIYSRLDGETWLRSNADMVISDALEVNLYGQEAMSAAIESYQSAQGVNSLNSTWYLNLANGQPFYGQLANKPFTLEFEGEGGATIQRDIVSPIGSVVNTYGNLQPLIPVDASGNLIVFLNGAYTTMDDPTYGAAEGAKVKAADVYLWMTGSSQTYTWKEAYSIQIQA